MLAVLTVLIAAIAFALAGFPLALLAPGAFAVLVAVWIIRFGPDVPATIRGRGDIPWYRRW